MSALKTRPERVRAFRALAQHLGDGSQAGSLADAAAVCGVTGTTPGAAALALAMRVPAAEPADVERAIHDERTLVVAWSRRGLPCLVPAADLGVFTLGLRPSGENSWREALPGIVAASDTAGLSVTELVDIAASVVVEELDSTAVARRDLVSALARRMPPSFTKWFDDRATASAAGLLVRAVSLGGACVLVSGDGDDVDVVRTDRWLGAFPDASPEAISHARAELTRRFVHAYGPASARAFAEWAGIGEAAAREYASAVESECAPVSVEGAHGLMLAHDAERLEGAPEPAGVRYLPPSDPYLASPDRRVIVPEAPLQKRLWRGAGNPGAVWADGEIAAAWRAKGSGNRIAFEVETFRTLPATMMRALELAAPRAAAFMGASVVKVTWK